jgi:hypothetical protein
MAGRLTLGGNVRQLLDQPDLMAALTDVTARVREQTTFVPATANEIA